MSYSKLIHDYLDGELNASQQDLLFSELAHNTELRQEFNQQVRLQTLAQSDLPSITPPTDAANAVFAKLGFSIPNSDFANNFVNNKPTPTVLLWKSTFDFLKKRFPTFLTSVLSATITALIFLYFLNNNLLLDNANLSGPSRMVVSTNTNELQTANIPNALVTNQLTRNISQDDFEKLFSKALADYFAANPINLNTNAQDSKIAEQNVKSLSNDNLIDNFNRNNYLQTNTYQNKLPLVVLPNSESNTKNRDFVSSENLSSNALDELSLSIRSFTSQSSTKINVPSNANPWFNNMALSIGYNLNKYHSFGLEVGQEQFAQRFQKTEFDLTSTYEQNPLLFWYGGYYRFSYPDIIFNEKIFPFAQIFGGATSVGPVIKSQLGIQYKPDKRVTFILGGEMTKLLYKLQNNIYNTDKFGITYGISIQY
ncbi:MAG: hypothetical protein N2319_10375 [Candidatus Kapabacteria bacterium]|nr:hypothetical protein [Candidatus Kapabacteria bacterium]